MRRDMDLILLILTYVSEARETGNIPIPVFEKHDQCQVRYHVRLCEEAGYLNIVVDAMTKIPVAIIRMTWDGHEALERRCK